MYKLNKSGELLKRFGKKGRWSRRVQMGLDGVAVAGDPDRVFVCDRNNHRVQVLTTELEPVKQFWLKRNW